MEGIHLCHGVLAALVDLLDEFFGLLVNRHLVPAGETWFDWERGGGGVDGEGMVIEFGETANGDFKILKPPIAPPHLSRIAHGMHRLTAC